MHHASRTTHRRIQQSLLAAKPALFGFGTQPPIAHGIAGGQLPIAPDSSGDHQSETGPIGTHRDLSGAIGSKIEVPQITWFLPTQAAWRNDL